MSIGRNRNQEASENKGDFVAERLKAIEKINERTKHGGAEIVKYLKTGSAYYAPSASAVAMAEAILLDSNRLIPACAFCNGEYGINDVYCGVPVILNKNGLQKITAELNNIPRKMHSIKP